MRYYVIDLDGPNYQFLANLRLVIAELTDTPVDELPMPGDEWSLNLDDWGIQRKHFDVAYSLGVLNHGLLWEGEPSEGAAQGWAEIASLPDTYIHVVTSRNPFGAEAEAHEATNFWLSGHGMVYDAIDFAHDKVPAVRANITREGFAEEDLQIYTIDDKTANCNAFAGAGWHSYVYDGVSNEGLNLPRVSSMYEFAQVTT